MLLRTVLVPDPTAVIPVITVAATESPELSVMSAAGFTPAANAILVAPVASAAVTSAAVPTTLILSAAVTAPLVLAVISVRSVAVIEVPSVSVSVTRALPAVTSVDSSTSAAFT